MTRLASRALLLAPAAAVLAGCTWTSPAATQLPYEPSDGTGGEVGDLLLRNVLVVAAEEGEQAALVGVLVNRGPEELSVDLSTSPEEGDPFSETVDVPANSSVQLTEEEVVLESIAAPPGALLPLSVRTDEGGVELQVPVLDPSGPYDGLLPTDAATTAEDPVTPSPSGEPSTSAPAETEGGDG